MEDSGKEKSKDGEERFARVRVRSGKVTDGRHKSIKRRLVLCVHFKVCFKFNQVFFILFSIPLRPSVVIFHKPSFHNS